MQYGLMMKIKNIFRLGTKPPKVEALTPLRLYRSIYELPLSIFIDCYCDANYSGLVINGDATEQELAEVWQDLLQQYTELIGGREVQSKITQLSSIIKLEFKLRNIEKVLQMISMVPSEKVYSMLFLFKYPIQKLEYNETNLQKVLQRFVGYYKLDKTKYQILATKETAQEQTQKKQGRSEFSQTLTRVSIAFKMPPINIAHISTAQYCNYVVEYQQYCENLQKENKWEH